MIHGDCVVPAPVTVTVNPAALSIAAATLALEALYEIELVFLVWPLMVRLRTNVPSVALFERFCDAAFERFCNEVRINAPPVVAVVAEPINN